MLLKAIVLIGLAIYLYQVGQIGLAFLALASIIPNLGLLLAFVLCGLLIWNGLFIATAVLVALIVFNFVGNHIAKKNAQAKVSAE